MHRFFVPEVGAEDWVSLPPAEARHARRVLRLATADRVILLNGLGGEFAGSLEIAGADAARVRVDSRRHHPAPAVGVTLIQAIAKGPAMEGLIHRAVELGCARLVPLIADRSVSRPEAASAKQAKWQTIADEAMKQSGNPWRMTVEPPQTVSGWLALGDSFELLLIASLEVEPQHAEDWLDLGFRERETPPQTIGLVIGPEGDFTPEEYAAFRSAGARPFSLGPYVLRVETAATASLAVIQSWLRVRAARAPRSDRIELNE